MGTKEKLSEAMSEIRRLLDHVKAEFQRLKAHMGDSKLIKRTLEYLKKAIARMKVLFEKHIHPRLKYASGQALTHLQNLRTKALNQMSKMHNHILTSLQQMKAKRHEDASNEADGASMAMRIIEDDPEILAV